MEQLADVKCFDGQQLRFQHDSKVLDCAMQFSVFLPPQANSAAVPVLYWLSGLTCTDENFAQKSGAQRYAAEHGIALVMPDTSPRGSAVPDDPDGAYDLGWGAGFYVNATQAPWSRHYRMYDYISVELPQIVSAALPIRGDSAAISGHSMGGHGALVIGLRNPQAWRSISAFAPIVAPTRCPWGEKAFSNYLGDDRGSWAAYDAVELIAAGAAQLPLLVDQGDADQFLREQLRTELLEAACAEHGYPAQIQRRAGYDHSYYFIASFIGEHIAFHAAVLNG